MLIKLLPIILPIILAVITFKFSANRTVQNLKKSSTEVTEPQLTSLIQKMAKGEKVIYENSGLSKREWNELMTSFDFKEKIV